jgi:hypothetical protein
VMRVKLAEDMPLAPSLPLVGVWTGDIEDSVRRHRGHSVRHEQVGQGSSMPFRELSIMDQREELAKLALAPGANKAELFRRFGVSRSNGYKWMKRYAVEGRAGLSDRSRRPHRSPGRTEADVETQVLEIRAASNGAWGGRKIARVCAGMDPSRFRQPVRSRRSFVGMASWTSVRANIQGRSSGSSEPSRTNCGRWISKGTLRSPEDAAIRSR